MTKNVLTRTIIGLIFLLLAGMATGFAKKPAVKAFEINEIKTLPFLTEKGNVDYQPLQLKAKGLVDSCTVVITVEGNDPYSFTLKKGDNKVEIPVKAVAAEKNVQVSIESKGMQPFQQAITLKPVKKLICYLLPHSHTDIGYTEIQTAVEDKQVQNLVKGMEIAKRTANYPEGARFIWNVEVGWAADLYLNRMNESQRNEFIEAVKNHQVALNGMYLNVLTGLCRPEELSRLFKFSTEIAKKCNVTIDAAMTSDIPGQIWGTVTAMSQAGIKYFSTAPNYFDRIGDILVQWENKPFYWVSPSGKEKVLVWVPLKGYALSHMIKKLSPEFVSNYMTQLDTMRYPYDISYLRWSGHGDNAEPDPQISEFIKDWSSRYTWPKFIISSTSDAFATFEKKYSKQIPLIKGDWTPYWEDGAGSSALETSMNRASSDRLSQAEALWSMKDPASYPAQDFEAAWKKVLLYSEHTWGAWCSVSDPENQKTKEQWAIKQSYALDADKFSRQLLAKSLAINETGPSSKNIEVINTNGWERSEVITVPASLSGAGDKVKDSDGKPVLSQRLSNGNLAIWVKAVPSFSSRQYKILKGKAYRENPIKTEGNTLDNGLVSVKLNPRNGSIRELITSGNKSLNFVDAASGYGLNDYAFLDSVKMNNILRASNVKITVKEHGPLVASLLIESDAAGCNKLTREVRLTAGSENVELINTVDKKRAQISKKPGDHTFAQKGGKESVNFAFPFNVQKGAIHLDVAYGVMEPEKDQIASACKNWLTINRWADVSNQESGIALISMDAPLIEVGGITAVMLGSQTNPNVWRKHIEPTQTLFSWVMNNHWGNCYVAG
ncbi:MAG: hypothetical protein M1292_02090, partial [Bacteroidetes bacterium]|nr:hypothetical protein [Bacteroidota bacterium]